MKTDFLSDFIKAVDYERLCYEAHMNFTSLRYSDATERKVEHLKDQLHNCTHEEDIININIKIEELHEYGSRFILLEDAFLEVISHTGFRYDYVVRKTAELNHSVKGAFKTLINDINLGGINEDSQINHLQNILKSTGAATRHCLGFHSYPKEMMLKIFEALEYISFETIKELSKRDHKVYYPKYDFEKITEYLSSGDNPGDECLELTESAFKNENHYLFIIPEREDILEIIGSFDESDLQRFKGKQHTKFRELFKGKPYEKFDVERILSDENILILFQRYQAANAENYLNEPESQIRLNYPPRSTTQTLMALFEVYAEMFTSLDSAQYRAFFQLNLSDSSGNPFNDATIKSCIRGSK